MELASEGADPPLTDDKKRQQLVVHIVGFDFGTLERVGAQIASVGRLSSSIAFRSRAYLDDCNRDVHSTLFHRAPGVLSCASLESR
jgi:hypothetical protein